MRHNEALTLSGRTSRMSMNILRTVFVAAVLFALTWMASLAFSSAGAGWALLLIAIGTAVVAVVRHRLPRAGLAIVGLLLSAGGCWSDFEDQTMGLPLVILGCLLVGWNEARLHGRL
jgi:hypothetical protein